MQLEISIVPYKDSRFEVILRDAETGEEITLSGKRGFTQAELRLLGQIAPPCVYTRYVSREGGK